MNAEPNVIFSHKKTSPRAVITMAVLAVAVMLARSQGADSPAEPAWRALPLVTNGKVDSNWVHTGWGGFVVEDGGLRSDCDAKGLGLLVYQKEKLGNCQIRVVFKQKEPKSNSGVYVRIDDGIFEQVKRPGAAFERDAAGKPTKETLARMQTSSEQEEGPWYAVHHGYEIQIADADAMHRTGAIYSLAGSSADSTKAGVWRTMIVTLAGDKVLVDIDGQRVTTFDPQALNLPPRKQWYEGKREPKRPLAGYFGLQNHDPGDIVWFKEVSVRPLPKDGGK